jgi:hypothetical protein
MIQEPESALRDLMTADGKTARQRAKEEDSAIGRPEPSGWQHVDRPADAQPWKREGVSRSSWYEARPRRARD